MPAVLPVLPPLADLQDAAYVVALPVPSGFRGITTREAMLLRGPAGWSEFSPFVEYGDEEAAMWLAAAIEYGWGEPPPARRTHIRVNATVPAMDPRGVPELLARFPGCGTAKVKVAGGPLDADVALVAAVRDALGPDARLRVDANGGWPVPAAERAILALRGFDLEYVEQPCRTVPELAALRRRDLGVRIAADESIRRATDPHAVVREQAADVLIVKAQPLGGLRRAVALIEALGLPVTVSSALDTSVGLAMGAHLAAALPTLDYACGLGTAALLGADVTRHPLIPDGGVIPVGRVAADPALLTRYAAPPVRRTWWLARLERCFDIFAGGTGLRS